LTLAEYIEKRNGVLRLNSFVAS